MASAGRSGLPRAATGTVALGLLAALGLPQLAAAEMVTVDALLQQSTLVINQQSNVYSFTAPGPGTLYVGLQDVLWPTPLSGLNALVNSPSSVLGTLSGSGQTDLTISKGGTYYVDVSGAAGGALDVGLYSLSVNFVPQGAVPLPGTVALLFGGLLALGGARWWWMRNESVMYTA